MIIITGIKMKIGSTSDLVEAFALGHMNNDIHIYSNSWGPRDWGFTVSGPGDLVKRALETGVEQVNLVSPCLLIFFP